MQTEIVKTYKRFRKDAPFMLVGRQAELALEAAKTLTTFRTLEDQGLVRIEAIPEEESYFDVFGDNEGLDRNGHPISREQARQNIIDTLERDGCWYVVTEYLSPETEEWEHADSIGMCTGYNDPTSPFENCYVIQLMQEAIDKLASETSERND